MTKMVSEQQQQQQKCSESWCLIMKITHVSVKIYKMQIWIKMSLEPFFFVNKQKLFSH